MLFRTERTKIYAVHRYIPRLDHMREYVTPGLESYFLYSSTVNKPLHNRQIWQLNQLVHYFLQQVINFTPTNSYLDDCLFNQMVAHAQKHPNKPRSAEGWILKGSNYHKPTCVSATFDSLVKLGLLRKERRNLGTCVKYPTVNPGTV